MRKDPPFDMEYVYSTHLLEYAQQQGAKVQHRRGHPQSPGKAGHHRNQRVHRAHAGDPQHGPSESLPRQAPGRDRQAAGRHGWHRRVPAAAQGSQPQRHPGNADRQRRAHHHGAALHPRDRQGRQAHPADRRRARAVLPGPHPAGRRNARQPGGRRTWRGPAAVAARPRDRRGGGARWPPAACCWSAWTSSATTSPRSMSPAPPVSWRSPNRPASTSPACSRRRSRKQRPEAAGLLP